MKFSSCRTQLVDMRIRSIAKQLSLSLSILVFGYSMAAEQSREPVDYVAQGGVTMSMEGDIRIVEMAGPVQVTQGSILIEGDHAVFEYMANTGRLIRATVDGSPVNYNQELDNDQGVVTGTSEQLVLFEDEITLETMIEMIGNAIINTPDSNMNCAALLYNSTQNLIPSSTGPCGGSLSNSPN